MAYESVTGPLGPERFDILHALQMTLLFNQWAKKGKEKKPKDFLPEWDQGKRQTPADMLAALKAWTATQGGTVKHGDDS